MLTELGGAGRWLARQRRHIRVRMAAISTALLAVALLIAGASVLLILNQSLKSSTDAATSARADLIAHAVAADGVGGVEPDLMSTAADIDVVQIIDAGGRVIASGVPRAGGALVGPVPAGSRATSEGAADGDGIEYRVSVVGVAGPHSTPVTIAVGAAEAPIHRVVLTVALLLAIVFPLLLLVLAVTAYYFAGRALAPVESIRAEVAQMSRRRAVGRVPVPGTDDEIETLARTMNDMLARIDAAQAAQSRFVGDASHELRSPLTTIVGLSDLSRVTGDPIDADTVRDILHPEAIRLQGMVEDLLMLARADEGQLGVTGTDVDLDELMSAEARRLEALGRRRVDVDLAPVRVRGDRAMLLRAIRNVTDNAARHARSTVRLRLRSHRGTAVIVVSDDGSGIPDADKQRVFERFVRLDSARSRRVNGTGLGLAIVAEIVAAHDGTIAIADAPGGGTAVRIELPTDAAGGTSAAGDQPTGHQPPSHQPPGDQPADVAR